VKEVVDTNLRAGTGWSLHSNTSLRSLVPGAPPESSCDLLMTRVDGGPVVVSLGDTGQRATDEALGADAWQLGAAGIYFDLSSPTVQWGGLVTW